MFCSKNAPVIRNEIACVFFGENMLNKHFARVTSIWNTAQCVKQWPGVLFGFLLLIAAYCIFFPPGVSDRNEVKTTFSSLVVGYYP